MPWIQLNLSGTALAANDKLAIAAPSASQVLDATALSNSNGHLAIFDRGSVTLALLTQGELFRGRPRPKSCVGVLDVSVGVCNNGIVAESTRCLVDNHTQWDNVRVGRIVQCMG